MKSYLVLEDIPCFLGPDMKEYGGFKKDVCIFVPSDVPECIARLLLDRNLIQEYDLFNAEVVK